MVTEKKTKAPAKTTPGRKNCANCPIAKGKGLRPADTLVEKVLEEIETKIAEDQLKPTVGDFLRLLQYREEKQEHEQPKEIKVTWVEPEEKTSESGE